jgi:hypothetical protein
MLRFNFSAHYIKCWTVISQFCHDFYVIACRFLPPDYSDGIEAPRLSLTGRVSFETSFDSKQPKLEPKLVSALSETKRLFRLFRVYTETESFDVSIEPKQTEDQPKQFVRDHILLFITENLGVFRFFYFFYFFLFFSFFSFLSVCFETVCFGCFASIRKEFRCFDCTVSLQLRLVTPLSTAS